MTRLRAFLVALTILAMAFSPLLIPSISLGAPGSGTNAFAAPAAAPAGDDNDNGDDDDDDNSDDDDDDDNSGGDNSDGDNSDGDNGDDDDNSDNDNADENDNASDDNDNAAVVEVPAAPVEPPAPLAPVCSTPGQEMAFTSDDGRIAVRVFGTMTQSLKFSIRIPVDPASVPPAPGPIVGNILFQLMAETCDGTPLATLPAEINLGVSYTDADAVGMNEGTFTLGWLDSSANRWNPTLKQATDPPANYASATITDMGYYVLYQRS